MNKTGSGGIGDLLRISVQRMTKGFYLATIGAVIIGVVTYYAVSVMWSKVVVVKDGSLPLLVQAQLTSTALEGTSMVLEKYFYAESDAAKLVLMESIKSTNKILDEDSSKLIALMTLERDQEMKAKMIKATGEYLAMFKSGDPNPGEAFPRYANLKTALAELREHLLKEIDQDLKDSESTKNKTLAIIIILSILSVGGMIITGGILSGFISRPVTNVAENLSLNSKEIEGVTGEILLGAQSQTDIVKVANKDLEDMIINIIQGSITMNVEKQVEIANAFAEFLKQFVERTSAEIAMGMMSVSQQSEEARSNIEKFVSEITGVEKNIRVQENTIEAMVNVLKGMVEANEEIKKSAHSSTEAADTATKKAADGENRIKVISRELEDIRKSSEGVGEITESLAKITENIKILALNMSLKVEDIRDDTGKSYGFEAMSARVQELAEETEKLLVSSREMIIPTIRAIQKVSNEAVAAGEMLSDVTRSIKIADDGSKAIAIKIDGQTTEIEAIEREAENLRSLAKKSTESIASQAKLGRGVDESLKDARTLIDVVAAQTKESSDAARKINHMMEELKKTVASIEDGTGSLTQKSMEISDLFTNISTQAEKNMDGAKRLGVVTDAVRDITRRLAIIVKGEAV